MSIKDIFKAGHIVSFIIGMLFGTGAIWEYQKIEIEKQQLAISAAEKTTQLRKELDIIMEDVLNINRQFSLLNLCSNTPYANNRAIELRAKLDLYKQNFNALEIKLAALEGRDVRDINLQFSPPCPPTGLSIRVQ